MQNTIVIIDTNVLLTIGECNINLDSELERIFGRYYQLATAISCKKELEKRCKGASKLAQCARLALSLITKKKYILFDSLIV